MPKAAGAADHGRSRAGRSMPRVFALLLVGLVLTSAFLAAAAWWAVRRSGYTPGQILDYAERRLEGHPRWQTFAVPVILQTRRALDEPAAGERLRKPFVVPPPPAAPRPAPGVAGDGAPGVVRVGPTRTIRTIAAAAQVAKDGDVVEIDAGEYRADVAVWMQRRLVIRGVGGRARLIADGPLAEGKAIWVLRDGIFEVSNVDFVGARAPDRNGAGIRIQAGELIIRDCLFWGSDSGLMTGQYDGRGVRRLEIVGSEFGYLGHGDGQSHHVYVEASELFRVTGSYFHHGNVGHLIKSRSAVNDIRYNRITDERGGRAAYEIDLPNGGIAVLVGNVLQQNRETENPALISYGREGWKWPVNRLFLVNNTLVNEHPHRGAFLRTAEGSDGVYAANNLLVGIGRYHVPEGVEAEHDVRGETDWFYDVAAHDYRLTVRGQEPGWAPPPFAGPEFLPLVPTGEYVHSRQVRALDRAPGRPGAAQSPAR
jgi:hypothetical protein